MGRPLRVLHVVNGFGVGGVSWVVRDWIAGLEGSRFHCSLLVLSEGLEFLKGESLPDGVDLSVVPIEPPPDHSVAGYLRDGFLLRRARARGEAAIRRIREIAPDVLHLHTVAQDLAIGIVAARGTGTSLVYTDHILRIRTDEYSPLVRFLLRAAHRRLYRRYHLISVGAPVARANRAGGFIGPGKLHLELRNQVDTERFRPAEAVPRSGGADAPPYPAGSEAPLRVEPVEIVYVARIHHAKGQDTLVRAFRAMRTRTPVRLTLVGPDETGGAFDAVLHEPAGEGRPIRILGSRFDVPEILRASDIGAFPSLREGRPLALLEMMATGLPVVVSDIAELTDMVRHGTDGLIVPAGDVPALAEALDRLVDDPALRARLGGAARDAAVAGTGESPAAAVARFYEEVLRRDGAAA